MDTDIVNTHELDDSELRNRLESLGEKNVGPLTETTRPLFEKRLAKLLNQHTNDDLQNGTVTSTSETNEKPEEKCGAGDFDTESKDAGVLYYGLNIPPGSVCAGDDDISLVYTDKKEALRAMKKCKSARFKMFKSESEALEFASSQSENLNSTKGSDITTDIIAAANGLRPSPFRGPKSQELVKLRKAIECGNIEYMTETIWSNPRYLVSSGDTPTILQEGSRYNALHVAAKMRQYEATVLILNVVENKKFMQVLYNDDSEDTCNQRVNFLTDLYLNTPDKGLCETPLHFASKFGSAEIVNLFVSHPLCDLDVKNKYGQTAAEIVCCRCPNETPELKSRIEDCFQNRYYIPVLRSDDNSQLPSVGLPWSPTFKKPLVPSSTASNPLDTPVSVKAYAGPMSPKLAAEFHRRLSTPSKSKSSKSSFLDKSAEIRLSDVDKGLERIGRELASEMKVSWAEYWPFLKCYCDLSKPDGISKLELHLKNKYNEVQAKENAKNKLPDTDKEIYDSFTNVINLQQQQLLHNSSDVISSLCEALRNLNLDTTTNSSINTTSSSSSSPNHPPSTPGAKSSSNVCICPRRMRCHSGPAAIASPTTDNKDYRRGLSVIPIKSTNFGIGVSQGLTVVAPIKTVMVENNFRRANSSVNVASFVERSCDVIGSQIFSESTRFTEALEERPDYPSPQKAFTKSILPYVKCLFNIMSHLVTQLATEDYKEIKKVFGLVHYNVAVHVCWLASVNEGNGVRDFFRVLSLPDTDLVMLSDLSDDEIDDDGERDRIRKRRKRKILLPLLGEHLKCVINMLIRTANVIDLSEGFDGGFCRCCWDAVSEEDEGDYRRDVVVTRPVTVSGDENDEVHLAKSAASDTSADVFFTPNGSWHSSRCSSVSEVWTPDEGLAVFIEGSYPSKIDLDVMRALENVVVDPVLYPHIHRWKFFLSSYRNDKESTFYNSIKAQSLSRPANNYPLTSTPSGRRNIRFNPFTSDTNNGGNISMEFPDFLTD